MYAEAPDIKSAAAILIDAETGQILFEKNKDEKLYPASITKVLTIYLASLAKNDGEEFAILLMPDHPTPLAIRTHTSDPVPYIIYKSGKCAESGVASYTEAEALKTGVVVEHGYTLIERLTK